ncbi:Microtubule binding Kinesin motor domain [Trypanosoma vivax]|uniref:Putative kinesin n=1 Tax=Trypanosoma vivax (strain Y486) TaxID=1055687 RepID=G0TSL9_TRYVY|nr:putative kinesin [Trypanosoma vivax]KAH8605539.1 Microtubule binding Kinesin motor domain [Trypanosoma vivax]CCC46946.1 putative kinesin [Trypanosoma vivax Y486]
MSNIKVAVRCRPLFENERPAAGLSFVNERRVMLDNKTYDPDYIFSPTATQDDVFAACEPILQSVKEGLHGTVMVYGQTGTGKTYTMLGGADEKNGLAYRMINSMLEHVQQKTLEGVQCALTLSMVEIYNERLIDMLGQDSEAEVMLVGGFPVCTQKIVLSQASDAYAAIHRGLHRRHTAATLMNERSSRSHVVIIVDYEERNTFTNSVDITHLFMVDLAGSESLKKSQVSGAAAGEAGKINKSLLALKSVFLALANSSESSRPNHVPYRDSKLTEILRDSIGGSARTFMIACISSVGRDIEETKSTLMYAVKARSIRNQANTEREKLMVRLRSFEVENQRLRNRLQERVVERGGYYVTREEHERCQQLEEEHCELKKSMETLLHDRHQREGQQHIADSQTSVLKAMVEEKEDELHRFKQVYHEALAKFDAQVGTLQSVVQEAVRGAQATCRRSNEAFYERLERWRSEALREERKEGAEASEKGVTTVHHKEHDGPLACTKSFEEEAVRAVERINSKFASLTTDIISMTGQYCEALQKVQERRRASLVSVQQQLEKQLKETLSAYAQEQLNIDRELSDAQEAFVGRVSMASKLPKPADPLPFFHTIRNACRSTVESTRDVLTSTDPADDVVESLQQINEALRISATGASMSAFLQMGNLAPGRSSVSSQCTNAKITSPVDSGSGVINCSCPLTTEAVARQPLLKEKNRNAMNNRSGPSKRLRTSSNASDSRRGSVPAEREMKKSL